MSGIKLITWFKKMFCKEYCTGNSSCMMEYVLEEIEVKWDNTFIKYGQTNQKQQKKLALHTHLHVY